MVKNTPISPRRIKMFGSEEYGDRDDYEDTSRFLGEQYLEKQYIENEIEERMRNESRV